jgi:tetratricopeptide (TPR) repeat protein
VTSAVSPQLIAVFGTDEGGSPAFIEVGGRKHYKVVLEVENAPKGAYAATFELDPYDYDPSRTLRPDADGKFRLATTAYGDCAVRVRLRTKDGEVPLFSNLARALQNSRERMSANSAIDGAIALISLRAHGHELARAEPEEASRYVARYLGQEARVDDLQLSYRSAAAKYAEAAALMGPLDTPQQWRFLLGQADQLYKQGDEFGDNAALVEAIDVYRRCLTLAPRSERPLDWARTQNDLGNTLRVIGERESGTARLEEAVSAYREALNELTRARVPLDWAGTQVNLGNALFRLGERESGTARLEDAVAAYREALQEYTRARVPLEWARSQNNLGAALRVLAERESSTARLEEAVAAYREALQEWTRERVPRDWAATQNNLGIALATLGERESGTARLEEAVAAYREALQELTRARAPLDWAQTQRNLGNALKVLGELEIGTARLEESVAALREALQENTRARVPLEWARTQMNLALVYRALFDKDHQPRHLDEALEAADGALEEFRKANAAFYIDKAERQRGEILAAKSKL